jgi:3,4-dihydroxy 2-butanone 4-phosphate synthase / GTP cyclohydrolase II
VTTGISAADRATTIKAAVKTAQFQRILQDRDMFFRSGQRTAEFWCEPVRLKDRSILQGSAGLKPAAVICEIMNDNGTMARMPELKVFSEKYDIPIITIEDIIAYRLMTESLVEQIADAVLPTKWGGEFQDKSV